jgi:hypothetical protein
MRRLALKDASLGGVGRSIYTPVVSEWRGPFGRLELTCSRHLYVNVLDTIAVHLAQLIGLPTQAV